MHVIATAGHVDHGKSTLVRALTGMEPDRWAEERRRGMTLDLGFAWTTLQSGQSIAFVDVPGHERFVATMMAGVGPVPAVMVVVAADEGWRAQTTEHVAVLDALDIRHGLLVVTRCDLADPAPTMEQARQRLLRTSLGNVDAVAVSAVSGEGMPLLRAALDRLIARLPPPVREGRVRFFIDRAFSVHGSGTVVTGTLGAGTLHEQDRLVLSPAGTEVKIRRLESLGRRLESAEAVARVAINLRKVPVEKVRRGRVLVTPRAWALSTAVDIRLLALNPTDLPGDLMFHFGSAAIPCRLRPLGDNTARLMLAERLPLQPGDRAILREPSSRLSTGLVVLVVDPPPLRQRGAARARAQELEHVTGVPDPVVEVTRQRSMTRAELAARGILAMNAPPPDSLLVIGDRLVAPTAWEGWKEALLSAVDEHRRVAPLQSGLPVQMAKTALRLPDAGLVEALVLDSGWTLVLSGGHVTRPGAGPVFSQDQERELAELCRRLELDPLDAPEAQELATSGLTKQILAAAANAGLVLRLSGEVILSPAAVAHASKVVGQLDQPFTLSEARQALKTTRRVAVPLLEHLDALGCTVRVSSSQRRIKP